MKIECKRSLSELSRIVDRTASFFESHDIDDSLRLKVDLCIEELFVNMVQHNANTQAEILIEFKKLDDGIEVCLIDCDTERFDPTAEEFADLRSPLAERDPGKLGLYLVMKMVDSIHYEYKKRVSKITFTSTVIEQNV